MSVTNAMIAPFWDNLYQQGTNRVYHWSDTENGRYIVQWSRLLNAAGGSAVNFLALRPRSAISASGAPVRRSARNRAGE